MKQSKFRGLCKALKIVTLVTLPYFFYEIFNINIYFVLIYDLLILTIILLPIKTQLRFINYLENKNDNHTNNDKLFHSMLIKFGYKFFGLGIVHNSSLSQRQ